MTNLCRRGRSLLLFFFTASAWSGCQQSPSVQVHKLFYPDGRLQAVDSMQAGQRHGLSRRYFRNGQLQQVSHYAYGQLVGTTVLFDSTGRPSERHVYGSPGELIGLRTFDLQGRPQQLTIMPLLEVPDTLVWGQNYAGSIRFGFPLARKATLLIGTLGKDLQSLRDRYPMTDTLAVVAQSPDGRFYFSFPPAHPGHNRFSYKFTQPGSEFDSLSVHYLSSSHAFFVRPRPAAQ